MDGQLGSVPVVMATSVLLSQAVSNVPMVALYLPLLNLADVPTVSRSPWRPAAPSPATC
jgi:Na+/H+ antiporter NhaD/arsenite permease-like protein